MVWWKGNTSAEPVGAAVGVVAMPKLDDGIPCVACRTVLPVDALTTLHITPHGGQPEYVHVCRNTKGCRLRARAAGIYLGGSDA